MLVSRIQIEDAGIVGIRHKEESKNADTESLRNDFFRVPGTERRLALFEDRIKNLNNKGRFAGRFRPALW